MKQSPNWIKIQKLLKRYQCLHVAGQAIILASQLFDTSIPTDLTRLTNSKRALRLAQNAQFYIRQMVNLHSVPLPDEIAVYHSHYLFALMPLKQKILFTLSFLFPYPVDAETLPLPKPLHFLYFPLRPFLWSFRKTRKGIPEGAKR